MKAYSFRFLFNIVLLGSITFWSCSKSSDTASQSTASNFTWTQEGKTFTATIDTAFLGVGYTFTPFHIIAGFGTFPTSFNRRIDFHLTSFNIGAYTIVPSPATVNTLDYIDDAGFNLQGISGTLNITGNASSLLSGNFSLTLINGAGVTNPMSGSFSNVSIHP